MVDMLMILPDYELATRYGSAWHTSIMNAAINSGLSYVDLYGENATGTNFFLSLESEDPSLVHIFGHANYNNITGQHDEVYLTGGVNTNALAGRVVYNLSCQAGRDLGVTAVNEGAISFLGYAENFNFYVTYGDHPDEGMENPLEDETARGFFESHNASIISYINGSTTEESYYASQAAFDYWIEVWENIDSDITANLVWDKYHQVLIPEVGPLGPAPGGIAPLLLMAAPLLLIPLLKK